MNSLLCQWQGSLPQLTSQPLGLRQYTQPSDSKGAIVAAGPHRA